MAVEVILAAAVVAVAIAVATRAARIASSWQKGRAQRDALIFLQGLGLTAGVSSRVLRRYKEHTVKKVRENPYRLAVEVRGVGFLTADRLAASLGVEPDSPALLRAIQQELAQPAGKTP